MTPDVGTLKVVMPSLEYEVKPTVNVINAESLELVTMAVCLEEVSVPAGRYLLSATLPTGERSLGVAEVSPGKLEQVELAPFEPSAGAAFSPTPQLESLGVGPAAPIARPKPKPWFVRWLKLGPEGVGTADGQADVAETRDDGSVEFLVHVSGEAGVVFAQFAVENQVPLNVALPANGRTNSQTCRLTVESTDPLTATVSLPENQLVDTVARYLHTGALQEAASVAFQAEVLLKEKLADPYGAALGGYALLRLHDLDRLHDWSSNLAKWFPWLPDGAIVAGEKAALEGDYKTAAEYFCDAARRGLPAYADGFSMLVSRLREYGDPEVPPPGVAKELVKEAAERGQRISPMTSLVDFSRIMLAFTAAQLDDPVGSQKPFSPQSAGDGWRRFEPSTQTLKG